MARKLPRRRWADADIDLADIQGDVLRGYTYPCAVYLFLRIDDPDRARALMRRMLPQVHTAEPWQDGPPPTAMHVAFTYAGLAALDLPAALLDSFPPEFREGMAARAERLGDRGPSAPSQWEPGFGTGEAHVLVTLYGLDEARLAAGRDALRGVGEGAVTLVHEQRAAALEGDRDHFGFADGIAQPAIRGSGTAPRPGDGQPAGRGRWREVATGEFLHGYVDEDGALPPAPAAPFDRNGTFVVYRKLAMDVAAFRRFAAGAGYPGGPEMLAAKIVGRWPDGTPLARSPERPDPALAADPARINDFSYRDDADGLRCPVGAHIRRANPRDAEGFWGGRLHQPPPHHPPRAPLRPAAAAGTARGRRRRARPDLRLLQRRHLASVRDDPGALDRRRRPVRPRARQGLPGRRAARDRRQDDGPGHAAVLPQAAAAVRDAARRRVPIPAERQRPALAGRRR